MLASAADCHNLICVLLSGNFMRKKGPK